MMYRYGYAYGHGGGHGRGRRGPAGRWGRFPVDGPKGYRYVGPCRCGFGPHAYYQDEQGRIYPAGHIYGWGWGTPPPPVSEKEDIQRELDRLRHEKEELELRIRELEEKLEKKS